MTYTPKTILAPGAPWPKPYRPHGGKKLEVVLQCIERFPWSTARGIAAATGTTYNSVKSRIADLIDSELIVSKIDPTDPNRVRRIYAITGTTATFVPVESTSEKVLNYIRTHPLCVTADVRDGLGMSRNPTWVHIDRLVKNGAVEVVIERGKHTYRVPKPARLRAKQFEARV